VGVLQLTKSASDSLAESALALVHDELRPVLALLPDLRCCFVLRTLMGYSREQVGPLLNLQSEDVDMLSQSALVRFAALAQKRGQKMATFTPATSGLKGARAIDGAT
jgi:hypothetical protein